MIADLGRATRAYLTLFRVTEVLAASMQSHLSNLKHGIDTEDSENALSELQAVSHLILLKAAQPKLRLRELRERLAIWKEDRLLRWQSGDLAEAVDAWFELIEIGFARNDMDKIRDAIGDVLFGRHK